MLPVVKMPLKTEIYHFEMMDLQNNHYVGESPTNRDGLSISGMSASIENSFTTCGSGEVT